MKFSMPPLFAAAIVLISVTNAFADSLQTEHTQAQAPAVYIPGLGDMMGQIQMRHAKLWFAGEANNWQLATYELNELKEAFEDAAKYQPNFKGKPIAEMIGPIIAPPIALLEKAIDAKDTTRFAKAFDSLSNACMSCHQATEHGFIVIQRPSFSPLTNQRFELKH